MNHHIPQICDIITQAPCEPEACVVLLFCSKFQSAPLLRTVRKQKTAIELAIEFYDYAYDFASVFEGVQTFSVAIEGTELRYTFEVEGA